MRATAKQMAFGGVLAALAVVVMCLVTMVPVMTYVCPLLCLLLEAFVRIRCGKRTAWAWYLAVAILGLLLSPDKEAAVLLAFLGYYPIVKPALDRIKPKALCWVIKLGLLGLSVALAYGLLIWLLGMAALAAEFRGLGAVMGAAMLFMGLVCLAGLDLVLSRLFYRRR